MPKDFELAKRCVKHGADPRIRDADGRGVLQWTINYTYPHEREKEGWSEIVAFVEWQVALGLDPDRPDKWGKTPRQMATDKELTEIVALFGSG